MDEHRTQASLMALEHAAEALRRNNFEAEVCGSRASAAAQVLSLIGAGKTVGLGGSMTLAELGLEAALAAAGNQVVTHRPGMDQEARRQVLRQAQAAQVYLASPQAVTGDGKLILIDGLGNRVSSVAYGPSHVVLVAGRNKLVEDVDAGLWRMRHTAAVANNIRLKKNNPCVKTGRCEDCSSPERICNAVLMLWRAPYGSRYSVLLVNDELGY